jgi:uncharacterized membrane protein YqjE
MEEFMGSLRQLAATGKRLARRLLIIGENRLELLAVEMQEEREHLQRALLIALSAAVLGLLAGMTLTAAIVVLLWAWSPVAVLLILTVLYGAAGICLCRRLTKMMNDWQMLAASLDQFRKDRASLEKILE